MIRAESLNTYFSMMNKYIDDVVPAWTDAMVETSSRTVKESMDKLVTRKNNDKPNKSTFKF